AFRAAVVERPRCVLQTFPPCSTGRTVPTGRPLTIRRNGQFRTRLGLHGESVGYSSQAPSRGIGEKGSFSDRPSLLLLVACAPFVEQTLDLFHVLIAYAFTSAIAALQAVENMLPHFPRWLKRPPAHVTALHAIGKEPAARELGGAQEAAVPGLG